MIVFLNTELESIGVQPLTTYTVDQVYLGQGRGTFALLKPPPTNAVTVLVYKNTHCIHRGIIRSFNASTRELKTDEYWYSTFSGFSYAFQDEFDSVTSTYLTRFSDINSVLTPTRAVWGTIYDELDNPTEYQLTSGSKINIIMDNPNNTIYPFRLTKSIGIPELRIPLSDLFMSKDIGLQLHITSDGITDSPEDTARAIVISDLSDQLRSEGKTKFLLGTGYSFVNTTDNLLNVNQRILYTFISDNDPTDVQTSRYATVDPYDRELITIYDQYDSATGTYLPPHITDYAGEFDTISRVDYSYDQIIDALEQNTGRTDFTLSEVYIEVLKTSSQQASGPSIDFTYSDAKRLLDAGVIPGVTIDYKLNGSIRSTEIKNIQLTNTNTCLITIGTPKKYLSDYIREGGI